MMAIEKPIRRKLLLEMMRIRMIEEAIADEYVKQEMRCPTHLSIGQEAVATGVSAHLSDQDYVMSAHRAHAHYLAKGGNLRAMITEFYGRVNGCARGRGGSMHLIDVEKGMLGTTPIVASSFPLAVGASFGHWIRGEIRLSIVYLGDGSTEEGLFSECLNFAVLKKLPVIFVCENNFYSVYSHISERQPQGRDRVGIAKAHGAQTLPVADGNDVEAVYRTMAQAADYARKGFGPYYLEFDTYRWREHCGPYYDNDKGYRTEEEFVSWRKRCPIENYKARLLKECVISQSELADWAESVRREITEAFIFAKSSPYPGPEDLLTGLYKESYNETYEESVVATRN